MTKAEIDPVLARAKVHALERAQPYLQALETGVWEADSSWIRMGIDDAVNAGVLSRDVVNASVRQGKVYKATLLLGEVAKGRVEFEAKRPDIERAVSDGLITKDAVSLAVREHETSIILAIEPSAVG